MKNYLLVILCLGYFTVCSQVSLLVPEEYETIQKALNKAGFGDTVFVAPGTYYENIVWPEQDGINLIGEEGSENTIIDGDAKDRVICINFFGKDTAITRNTLIDGFTIQNGYAKVGVGIEILRAKPTLKNLIVKNNVAIEDRPSGIGMLLIDYEGKLENILVEDNEIISNGGWGAGIHLQPVGPVTFKSCSFINNKINDSILTKSDGAGLSIFVREDISADELVYFEDCKFLSNVAKSNRESRGGAIFIMDYIGMNYLFESCVFESNRAEVTDQNSIRTFGGGIYALGVKSITINQTNFLEQEADWGGVFHINSSIRNTEFNAENCEFINNRSKNTINANALSFAASILSQVLTANFTFENCIFKDNGVGVLFNLLNLDEERSKMNINHCTFFNNDSSFSFVNTDVTIKNSIIWNKVFEESFQESNNEMNNFNFSNSVIKGDFEGVNIFNEEPIFQDTITLVPHHNSIVIENASASQLDSDIYGNLRPMPFGSMPDIGAVEIDQTMVNTSESSIDDELQIPNPLDRNFTLADDYELSMYDVDGKLIQKKSNTKLIDIEDLSSGFYIIHLKKEDRRIIRKIYVSTDK